MPPAMTKTSLAMKLPSAEARRTKSEVLIANYPVNVNENVQQLTLRPYEARVYRLR